MNPYEPILKEIATGMLETAEIKPNFSNNALADAILILHTVLVDKVFDNQDYVQMTLQEKCNIA